MGILDIAEEAAGAFAADKALEAVDPNAGILAKAAAAVAGFEGVSAIKEHFDGSDQPQQSADDASTDQTDSDQADNGN